MTAKLFKGVDYDFGREMIRLSPLTVGAVEHYEETFPEMANLSGKEQLAKMREIILCSINRNYPEFTMDKLMEYLDVPTMTEVFNIVISISGLIVDKGVEEGSVGDNQGK